MSNKKPASIPASGSVLFIPLCKLKKSPNNARKTPHTKAEIEVLAASIKANGILQNPVVEPELKNSKPTGFYLVTIGEGRRLAQLLRAKRKEITKAEAIRCVLDTAHNAFEISLAENAIRSDMHPADQFEAFFKLHHEQGMSAEDIAARFGVTAAVVRQRLKLAAVSPKLIQVYRDGEMNLDQLTAFAITDDHARQEAVWEALPAYDQERETILSALTEEQVSTDDPRAVFVGADAYQAAGGAIIRDLFAEEAGGYLSDGVLLKRLAQEKLEALAATVKAEGWKWVEIMPSFDHSFTADLRRAYPEVATLSDEDQAKYDAIQAQYEERCDERGDSDETEAELDCLEAAMEALTGPEQFRPEQIACGGAIVTLTRDGEPRIERGYMRPEDMPASEAKKPREAKERTPALSDMLVAELTAHQTMALRNALANAPEVALIAVVHALAASVFYPYGGRSSCLHVAAHSAYLGGHAKDIAETAPAQEFEARHERWAKALPEDVADLWQFVAAMEAQERIALLAHCASLTVDAVRVPHPRERLPEAHIAQLTQAVHLDMAAHWQPTAANYFGRVSKERILEAVSEAVSKEAADNLKSLKKSAMADAAEMRMAQSGWLPPILRVAANENASSAVAAE